MKVLGNSAEKLKEELDQLDTMDVMIDGKLVKPSACYYFGSDPLHVLYNLNCPDALKQSIDNIISKYAVEDESSTR